jgi:hypothetical protein
MADCLFSKTVQHTTFPLWSEFLTLPFVRFFVKKKRALFSRKKSAAAKKLSAHGVEQAFRLAVRSKEKGPSLRRRPSRSAKRAAT